MRPNIKIKAGVVPVGAGSDFVPRKAVLDFRVFEDGLTITISDEDGRYDVHVIDPPELRRLMEFLCRDDVSGLLLSIAERCKPGGRLRGLFDDDHRGMS